VCCMSVCVKECVLCVCCVCILFILIACVRVSGCYCHYSGYKDVIAIIRVLE
jgi:hypothetical protein